MKVFKYVRKMFQSLYTYLSKSGASYIATSPSSRKKKKESTPRANKATNNFDNSKVSVVIDVLELNALILEGSSGRSWKQAISSRGLLIILDLLINKYFMTTQ